MVRDVKDLEVYRVSLELLPLVYEVVYKIPHQKLRTQLINSSEAIAPLIAEGFAKQRNQKEAVRFYEIAMGESDEVGAHLAKAIILAQRFPRIPIKICEELTDKYKILSKRIHKMIQVWGSYEREKKKE